MGDGDVIPIEVVDLENDDVVYTKRISSCRGKNKKNAISVERYSTTEDKELLHKVYKTASSSILKNKQVIDLTQEEEAKDDDDEVQEITPTQPFSKKPYRYHFVSSEDGQSSNSKDSTFVCEICVESRSPNESFSIKGCSHSYCSDCMVKYVASKIQENVISIKCPQPNCFGVLEPEYCRRILPQEVFDRWSSALCESLILGDQKFYCPFKDCSALLIDDGGMVVKESECPHCRRMFCAQCKVPWHSGINCEEFQKLNKGEREKEDIMLVQLAKKKNWKRCPNCQFYVEKSVGCNSMTCRCGCTFCYASGQSYGGHRLQTRNLEAFGSRIQSDLPWSPLRSSFSSRSSGGQSIFQRIPQLSNYQPWSSGSHSHYNSFPQVQTSNYRSLRSGSPSSFQRSPQLSDSSSLRSRSHSNYKRESKRKSG